MLFVGASTILDKDLYFCACGDFNRYGPHRLMCLTAWPTGSGTITLGLLGGNVSLRGPALRPQIYSSNVQYTVASIV